MGGGRSERGKADRRKYRLLFGLAVAAALFMAVISYEYPVGESAQEAGRVAVFLDRQQYVTGDTMDISGRVTDGSEHVEIRAFRGDVLLFTVLTPVDRDGSFSHEMTAGVSGWTEGGHLIRATSTGGFTGEAAFAFVPGECAGCDGEPADSDATATRMMPDGTTVSIWATEPVPGEGMRIRIEFGDATEVVHAIRVMQNSEVVLDDAYSYLPDGTRVHVTGILGSSDPVDVEVTLIGYGLHGPRTGLVDERMLFSSVAGPSRD